MTSQRPLPTPEMVSRVRWRHVPLRARHVVEFAARTLLGLTSLAALVWLGYRTLRYMQVAQPGPFVLFYGFNVFAAYKLWRSRLALGAISCAILLYQVRMHMSFHIDFDSGTTDGLFGLATGAIAFAHFMLFVVAYLQGITGQRSRASLKCVPAEGVSCRSIGPNRPRS